jgi:aldose 1-epimerase
VRTLTLRNTRGTAATLADWGATLVALELRDGDHPVDVVLGPQDVAGGLPTFPAAGSIVGRFANRIAGAEFTIDGASYRLVPNEGRNQLHGGPGGFAHREWSRDSEPGGDGRAASFRLVSEDGDQGYPGRLEVSATYALGMADELAITYQARSDRATPINLTHHAYFNLAGAGDVLGHELWIDADRYLPIDHEKIPTGEIASVEGTPFDFRNPSPIGARIGELAGWPGGYDHCLIFRAGRDPHGPRARLRHPESGRVLEIVTDQPGIQLYSGNHFDDLAGGGGVHYPRHGGVALETQHFPDSVHHPEFPPVILRPGEVFASTTILRFGSSPPSRS